MDAMRIDLDNCRDPDLLAGEVRRLRAVIASEQTLTDEEREAIEAAARIIDAHEEDMDGFSSGASATLRGLLERTLTTHANSGEGSVQDSDT